MTAPVTRDELRDRIADLSVWTGTNGERAPHKPLLLLWALARCARSDERMVSYTVVDEAVKPLLVEFGPPRRSYHTHYPFWYLRSDGLWEVRGAGEAKVREGKAGEPTKGELIRVGAEGGLLPDVYELLRSDPRLLHDLAQDLLVAHFPDTVHADILDAVGLDELELIRRRRRDPEFRTAVLTAYGYRCAVCDFDARLENAPLAVEAAHIMWHQAGGPDRVSNGLGLCSLHHKLLDRGAFTLSPAYEIVVSDLVNGGPATREALIRFHGTRVQLPRKSVSHPDGAFVEWHRREVFR